MLETKAFRLVSSNFSLLTFFKIQTPSKSHSLMPGPGFKLSHFGVFDILFPFVAFLKLQPIIL